MKFSVFTPTHNPEFLVDAYESLLAQAIVDWEWIIQPNGQALEPTFAIPETIRADRRVHVLPWTINDGIGSLKKQCCLHARGELLVELDHDDYLTADAFAEIWQTYEKGQKRIDFIYSDCVHFFPDHKSEVFGADWGWSNYQFDYRGKTYQVNEAFDIDARSLCEIFWAPNHVRVWTQAAYRKLGGHSGRLSVGDDHDLLCRTYLAGMNMVHIEKPLYFYRRYERNSFVVSNADVQRQQAANCDRYLHQLIAEQCRRLDQPMIDLGGGIGSPVDFLTLDKEPEFEPDICCDVLEGIPASPNSVGCFRAQDFLEHIPVPKVVWLMNHLYDMLAPGGWLITGTPAVADGCGQVGRGAFQDPTHVSYWSPNNFWYFSDRNYSRYVRSIRCRFQPVRTGIDYPSDWHRQNMIPYVRWDAMALKGQRSPGQQLI